MKIKDHVIGKEKGMKVQENEVLYLGFRQSNDEELMAVGCVTCGMVTTQLTCITNTKRNVQRYQISPKQKIWSYQVATTI